MFNCGIILAMAIYWSTTISDLTKQKYLKHCHSNSDLTSRCSALLSLSIVFYDPSSLLWFLTSVKLWIAVYLWPWGVNCIMRACVLNLHASMLLYPTAREKTETQHITWTCHRRLATLHQALWLFTKCIHKQALICICTSPRRKKINNCCEEVKREASGGKEGQRAWVRKKEREKGD